jgi:hypothetical protein
MLLGAVSIVGIETKQAHTCQCKLVSFSLKIDAFRHITVFVRDMFLEVANEAHNRGVVSRVKICILNSACVTHRAVAQIAMSCTVSGILGSQTEQSANSKRRRQELVFLTDEMQTSG